MSTPKRKPIKKGIDPAYTNTCPDCGGSFRTTRTFPTNERQSTGRRKICQDCGARIATLEYIVGFESAEDVGFQESADRDVAMNKKLAGTTLNDVDPGNYEDIPVEVT